MKRILNHNILLLLAFFAIGSFTSCEEEAPLVYSGPSEVHFPAAAATYFVNQENDGGFKIPVGVTAASDKARTFNVTVLAEDPEEESAVPFAEPDTHYTLESTTVTIPANEVVGYINVTANFANLEEPRKLAILLNEGQDNAGFRQSYDLVMRQFCAYDQADFVGSFQFTSTLFGGSWEVELVAGENPNEVIAKDLYADGSDIVIKLDDSDPTNFVATVATQNAWVHASHGQASVTSEAPNQRFSACEGTIHLTLRHRVAAGSFTPDETSFVRL